MFRSFWSHTVEHTPADRVWPITDNAQFCALLKAMLFDRAYETMP